MNEYIYLHTINHNKTQIQSDKTAVHLITFTSKVRDVIYPIHIV